MTFIIGNHRRLQGGETEQQFMLEIRKFKGDKSENSHSLAETLGGSRRHKLSATTPLKHHRIIGESEGAAKIISKIRINCISNHNRNVIMIKSANASATETYRHQKFNFVGKIFIRFHTYIKHTHCPAHRSLNH